MEETLLNSSNIQEFNKKKDEITVDILALTSKADEGQKASLIRSGSAKKRGANMVGEGMPFKDLKVIEVDRNLNYKAVTTQNKLMQTDKMSQI